MRALCTVPDCGKPRRSASLCAMHWNRLKRHGSTDPYQKRHGGYKLPEYVVWEGMRSRCSSNAHKRYGARGIKVCERWSDFAKFLEDMGRRPSRAHTIERKNSDGDYEPSNCVWATRIVQQNNMSRNRYVDLHGSRVTIAQAARILGIKYATAHGRVRRNLDLITGERHAD